MTEYPLHRDEDAEQAVADSLRRAPLPPMPEQIRTKLETVLREAQARREDGECAQEHREALIAASLRTSTGTFGPNPISRKRAPSRRLSPRTIGA